MSTTTLHTAWLAVAFLPALAVAEPLLFDQALSLAVQRSEAARAGRAAAQSATELSRSSGQLPDPMLTVGVENLPVSGSDRFNTTRDSMTMKRIAISQEWVPTDKRAARSAAATALLEREALQPLTSESEARLQVAMAYLDAWYAEAELLLATQTEHHLHEEIEASRSRLASAASASADVLQLTSARGMAEDDSDEARQQRASAFVVLERLVGFKPDALASIPVFPMPNEFDFVARNPTVAALQREVDLARRNAEVAAKERTPNWTWEVSYGLRTGYPDMVSFGVSVPLQVAPSRRQDRETAAKLALVSKAEAELVEATRTATADYRSLSGDAERMRQRIERYRTAVLVPARQRTAATLAAYRSNQGPLTALFESRHLEVEVQRKLLSLQRNLAKVQAQLAFKPLTSLIPGDNQ